MPQNYNLPNDNEEKEPAFQVPQSVGQWVLMFTAWLGIMLLGVNAIWGIDLREYTDQIAAGVIYTVLMVEGLIAVVKNFRKKKDNGQDPPHQL